MNKKFVSLIILSMLSLNVFMFPPNVLGNESTDMIDLGITDLSVKVNSTYARGLDYSVTYNEGSYIWKSEARRILINGNYEPYSFIDRKWDNGYYQVANSEVGVRLFDYYAIFYDINFEEVKLYDERWEVQRYKSTGQGSWVDVGAQTGNAGWSIVQTPTLINLTKTFTSWAGTLEITYTIAEGQPLKHTVIFTSALENEIFRVIQRWAGVTGSKLGYERYGANTPDSRGELDVIESVTVNASYFEFRDSENNFVIGENQKDALEWLEPVIIDTHANGMKADYIFSNWTLTNGESLVIDPATFTASSPSWDRAAYDDTSSGITWRSLTETTLFMGDFWGDASCCARSGVEWDVTAIPDSATITDTVFKYSTFENLGTSNGEIWSIESQPSVATVGNFYTDAADGTKFIDSATFPVAGDNQEIDLGASADTDLQANLGVDWWAIGLVNDPDTGIADRSRIDSEDDVGANPEPTLSVTYSTGATITVSVYAQDGSTTADNLTPVYLTMTNVTSTYVFSLSGLSQVLAGQSAGSMNFSAQAYNTTNSNSFIKINGTNIFEYTVVSSESIRFWISIYQSVEYTFVKENKTAFTPTTFEVTFGNNGTKANIGLSGGQIFVNGSNTIHQIIWQSDNVKNATNSFNVTSDDSDFVFEGRIYTLRMTAVDAIGMTTLPGTAVHYNLTLANSTVINPLATVDGIVGIYLQNSSSIVNVTSWWHGILVNASTIFVISGDNTSNMVLQVGRDLSDKTLFAEGTDEKGVKSMMIEGIEASYQVEPTSIAMNGTTYTSGTWIGGVAGWNYTIGLNLMNLSDSTLKSQTVIHSISVDTVNRQVRFNATGSETLWVVAYAGVACSGTVRTINLVNEVDSSAFDAGGFYDVNVTAFYDTYFLIVSENNQTFTVCDEPLLVASVSYNISTTEYSFFRHLIPSQDLEQNMYIPDIQKNDIELYTLQIVDLTDTYGGGTIRVTISGIEVSSGYLDSAFRFEVYLIDGFFFDVTVSQNGDSFTAGGLNANPGDTSIVVTIGEITTSVNRNPRSDNIIWTASWVGGNVQVFYNNTLLDTTLLNIKLYEQNFENKTYIKVFDTDYGATDTVTALYAGNSSRGYYAKISYTSTLEGSVSEQRPVTRSNMGFPSIGMPAGVLGLDKIFPEETNAWTYLISMFIVTGSAMAFGAISSGKGAIIVGVIGLFFVASGWLPGSVAYAIAAVSIAVLANLGKEKNN